MTEIGGASPRPVTGGHHRYHSCDYNNSGSQYKIPSLGKRVLNALSAGLYNTKLSVTQTLSDLYRTHVREIRVQNALEKAMKTISRDNLSPEINQAYAEVADMVKKEKDWISSHASLEKGEFYQALAGKMEKNKSTLPESKKAILSKFVEELRNLATEGTARNKTAQVALSVMHPNATASSTTVTAETIQSMATELSSLLTNFDDLKVFVKETSYNEVTKSVIDEKFQREAFTLFMDKLTKNKAYIEAALKESETLLFPEGNMSDSSAKKIEENLNKKNLLLHPGDRFTEKEIKFITLIVKARVSKNFQLDDKLTFTNGFYNLYPKIINQRR